MKEKSRKITEKVKSLSVGKKTGEIFKKVGKILSAFAVKLKKLPKWIKTVSCIVLAIAVALTGMGIYKWRKAKKTAAAADLGTSIVRAGALTNSISGSGSVQPIDQRDIVPVVRGKIIEAPFVEGDSVKEGDVLYRFEMTAATNAIESAQNSVEKAQTNLSNRQSNLSKIYDNIGKLTIRAKTQGKISGLSLKVGEEASGKVCTITNFKEQTVAVPFNSSKIKSINVGDVAVVAVDKYMINTTGEVVRKYTAPETLSNGAVVYYVDILLDETYILEEGVNVTATVNGIASASYGEVKYADPVTINASQRGEVKKINFKNGDWVNEGDIIAVLENDDLYDELRTAQQSVKEAQMNLTESMNNLEDKEEEANEYVVTSPIDGVILTKNYEVGDNISGQNSTTLMVVADMSKMKFTISADELDISKIQMGQNVSVTADALTGQRLSGRITAISKLGTSSNGVTNYPIEVTIDKPGDLMPGMNVSANIIVEQVYDALYLPVEAVEYFGGKYYVTVVGEVTNMPERVKMPDMSNFQNRQQTPEGNNKKEETRSENKEGQMQGGQMPDRSQMQGGQMPDRSQMQGGQMPDRSQMQGGQMPDRSQMQGGQMPDRSQMQGGQMPGRSQMQGGNWGERPSSMTEEKTEEKSEEPEEKTEEKAETKEEKTEKTEDKKEENKEGNKESGKESGKETNKGNFPQNSNRMPNQQREELKIKKYKEEMRVEVEIGVTTDTYYEIKSGVEYGQVVKNTTQTTSSSQGGFGGMRGGMPGGMMGGMSGARNMPGNRNMGGR